MSIKAPLRATVDRGETRPSQPEPPPFATLLNLSPWYRTINCCWIDIFRSILRRPALPLSDLPEARPADEHRHLHRVRMAALALKPARGRHAPVPSVDFRDIGVPPRHGP